MLSINIPVYNVEIADLVLQLKNQAEKIPVSFEIRVYDDGSDETFKTSNRKIAEWSGVVYRELKENIGRAAIRNQMGMDSLGKYLLFIDADSKTINDRYLAFYLDNASENIVLCGGTVYSNIKPAEPQKLLRWFYGVNREAVSAETRNRDKGFIITSNNFLLAKSVFDSVHFRDNLKNYGHEDTLLGFDLFSSGIKIVHIDNPVEHTGLEDAALFLNKTKTALKNLLFISEEVLCGDNGFAKQVRFLRQYHKITKIIPPFLLRLFFRVCHRTMEQNLKGEKPQLFLFDLFKLSYFSTIKKPPTKVGRRF